jgi:hypothetical protein
VQQVRVVQHEVDRVDGAAAVAGYGDVRDAERGEEGGDDFCFVG